MATAVEQGATVVNYMPVVALTKGPDGFINGVLAADHETGKQWTIAARVVVNATGAFSDSVRRLAEPDVAPLIAPARASTWFSQLLSVGGVGNHGAAHLGRPRDVRDSLARSHARRHDRNADCDTNARAATAGRGDRVHPRDGRPVSRQATDSRATS